MNVRLLKIQPASQIKTTKDLFNLYFFALHDEQCFKQVTTNLCQNKAIFILYVLLVEKK